VAVSIKSSDRTVVSSACLIPQEVIYTGRVLLCATEATRETAHRLTVSFVLVLLLLLLLLFVGVPEGRKKLMFKEKVLTL